jgi:hypothetical protein
MILPRKRTLTRAALALALSMIGFGPAYGQRLDGFNVIVTPGHPTAVRPPNARWRRPKRLGATTVAVVPILWQARPEDPRIQRGKDMPDDELRSAIREARALGLAVVVKPHVWVPESWAGAVAPRSEPDWRAWFSGYRSALMHIAEIAAEENADALAIGTELEKTSSRSEWFELILSARAAFPRTLLYVAHNVEAHPDGGRSMRSGSRYPPLGMDGDYALAATIAMRAVAKRLDALAVPPPIVVGEIGLRSAAGAAAKRWEPRSARPSPPAVAGGSLGRLAQRAAPSSVRGVSGAGSRIRGGGPRPVLPCRASRPKASIVLDGRLRRPDLTSPVAGERGGARRRWTTQNLYAMPRIARSLKALRPW